MKKIDSNEFHRFSKNLADLDASCQADDVDQIFQDFYRTFDSCTSVMQDILHYAGFRDEMIGLWTKRNIDGEESSKTREQETVIEFAADERSRLINPDDLRSWQRMCEDRQELREYDDGDEAYRRIADVYLHLLTKFRDLAQGFYKDPRKQKAMAGNAEVFYIRRKIGGAFKLRKIKKFFVKDEKILQKFQALKVYHNMEAYRDITSDYGPALYPAVDAFQRLDGNIIFTNLRIIIVRFKEKAGDEEFYFSYPYGKVNYFEIGRAPFWTKNRVLYLEFAAGPKLRFHFKSRWYIHYRKIVSIISGKLIK